MFANNLINISNFKSAFSFLRLPGISSYFGTFFGFSSYTNYEIAMKSPISVAKNYMRIISCVDNDDSFIFKYFEMDFIVIRSKIVCILFAITKKVYSINNDTIEARTIFQVS